MEVSVVAAIIVAICSMVIGYVWYSKMLFADAWMKESKLSMDIVNAAPPTRYMLTMIGALVMGLVMSLMVHRLGITQIVDGLGFAFLAWVGFVAPAFTATYLFALRSKKLLVIDSGYFLASLLVAGIITTLIR